MVVRYGKKKFRPFTPEVYRAASYSPNHCLGEDDLVFFLLDVIDHIDLTAFYAPYQKELRGAPPCDPAMMVCLLLYSYCVGTFSSRKIARACERNLAFLAIVGDDPPDFRTISDFRKIHLDAFKEVFLEVLRLAAEAGLIGLGNVSFDGSKFKADASRHKAMSYGYMKKEEQRLKAEIEQLLQQAQQADSQDDAALGSRRGDELPEELKRREDRLAVIQEAKQRLEEQARAEAEEERRRRAEEEEQRQRAGRKRRGGEPKPVSDVPDDKAQSNFTDPEMKMMPQSNKGWDYSGNAQASVDATCQIILACFVTVAANDKEQAVPLAEATMENLEQAGVQLPREENGEAKKIPMTADTGYYSKEAAEEVEERGFDPYMATGRQKHNQPLEQTTTASASGKAEAAEAAGQVKPGAAEAAQAEAAGKKKPTAQQQAREKMAEKVKTPKGRELYARRKVIVEPVFGQVKETRGFRQFSLRGQEKVNGEWRLVCLTHNLLKLWRHRPAPPLK
jgi:transposase